MCTTEANYSEQAHNNLISFFEDVEYSERKELFLDLVNRFQNEDIHWALACSMSLFFRGITDDFHDFDLLVDADSIDKVKKVLESLNGSLVATGGNGFCESDFYFHYQVGRIDIDIISGFRILTFGTSFCYNYNANEVDIIYLPDFDCSIPLISLEAMYILYYMMEGWQPKRRFKRQLIEQYFITVPPIHYRVFSNAINQQKLPGKINYRVKHLLAK